MTESPYDDMFFKGNRVFASYSAAQIVPLVLDLLPVESVADFGCAEGVWLKTWVDAGIQDIAGADGPQVDISRLLIDRERFSVQKLDRAFDLGRRFDLAQSLEVAEHIPAAAAEQFVASLVRHADLVLFSAAPPGQGGRGHINEQPYEYWRDLFGAHDFQMFDCLRPLVAAQKRISPWYRYNMFLFAASAVVPALPATITETEILPGDRVVDISPVFYRVRKAIIRRLPESVLEVLYFGKRLIASRAA